MAEKENDRVRIKDGGYTINHDKGKNSGEITTPLIWFQSRFDKGNKIIARYRNLGDNEYQFWDNFGGALFSFEIEGTTQNIACEKAIDRLKSIFKNGVPQKSGAMFEVTGYKFDELNKKEPFTPSFMTGTHIRNIMGDGKYKTEKGELLKFDNNGDGWDFYYVVDAYGSKVEDVPRLKGSIFSSLFGQGIIEPFIDKKSTSMANGGDIKEALNYVRKQNYLAQKRADKIKWFDKLPLTEKQDLFYKRKGRKISLDQFLKDNDKVAIWNKVHNGDYNKYAQGGGVGKKVITVITNNKVTNEIYKKFQKNESIFISNDDLRLFLETKYTFGYEDEQTKTIDGHIYYNYDELVKFYGFKIHFANNNKGRFDGWTYVIGTHPWIDYNLEKGNLDKSNIKYAKGGGVKSSNEKGKELRSQYNKLFKSLYENDLDVLLNYDYAFEEAGDVLGNLEMLKEEYKTWLKMKGYSSSDSWKYEKTFLSQPETAKKLREAFSEKDKVTKKEMKKIEKELFSMYPILAIVNKEIRNVEGGPILAQTIYKNGKSWVVVVPNYYVHDVYLTTEQAKEFKAYIKDTTGKVKFEKGGHIVGRSVKFKDYNGDIQTGEIIEVLKDGDYSVRSGFSSVLVTPAMIIKFEEQLPVRKKIIGMFEDGGNINEEIVVIYVNEYPYYLKKAGDTTHLYMANSREGVDIVIPGHIGQYNGTPYYSDIRSWLKGGESPNGKKYTESFKDGGSIDITKTDGRFLNKISNRVSKVWDEIGADSGGQIRSDKEMLNNYASKSLVEVEKLGLKQNSLTEKDFSFYENKNDHLLNEFLIWNNFYTTKFAEKRKDSLVESFKSSPNVFADPSIIKVVTDDEMYIPRSKIQSIKVRIDGKEVIIKGSDVLNGANR